MTAHVSIHFFSGMLLGTILALPQVGRAWISRRALTPSLLLWAGASMISGIVATAPSILNFPAAARESAWANVFILYPIVNRVVDGGMLIGQMGIATIITAQYLTILAAIARSSKAHRHL